MSATGYFGPYGGRYVPETVVPALRRLVDGDRPSGRYQARALAGAGVAG